jgi:hypothetical protein
MDSKMFQSLVEKAKADPAFFHQLIFTPEKVLDQMGEMDRRTKGALVGQNPAALLARAIGVNQGCGNTCTSSCDNTCGQSCGFTTNLTANVMEGIRVSYFSAFRNELAACGNTCTSSCDNTCGQSCGFTTNLTDRGGFNINPASFGGR